MDVRPLTSDDAVAIARWRYPGRYSTYDVGEVVDSGRGFWSVSHDGELVGYCCFGAEARVPGAVEEEGTVDVGYGIRPDLVGHGMGRAFVGAVCDFAVTSFDPQRLRLLILDWNERSLSVARTLGFHSQGLIHSTEGAFLVMTRKEE
jgi:[ribosomal protein S18]-alanine N-acetyltransferase